jgi:hypothetical protein
MNEKRLKRYCKGLLLVYIITSLCLPGRALAAGDGIIDSFLSKAKNAYENTLNKASDYKNAKISGIQNKINDYQTKYTNVKSSLSGIKSGLSGIKAGLPKDIGSLSSSALGLASRLSKSYVPTVALTGVSGTGSLSGVKSFSGIASKISEIGSQKLAGIKKYIPTNTGVSAGIAGTLSSIKSGLSGIKAGLPKDIGSLSSSALGLASRLAKSYVPTVAVAGVLPDISSVSKALNPPSQLRVKKGDKDVIEYVLNNFSSRPVYIDDDGYVLMDPGAKEDPNKSSNYSIVIESIINAKTPTEIWLYEDELASISRVDHSKEKNKITLGKIPAITTSGNLFDLDITTLHEFLHTFSHEEGLGMDTTTKEGRKDEEARAIREENWHRNLFGYPMRDDGSKLDDINNDGQPDGNGRYGEYFDPNNQYWWDEYYANNINSK